MKLITTLLFTLLTVFISAQGCDDPYPLDEMGTWSECWDAPQTFSDDYFEAWPETDLCGIQYGGVWLEFTTNSTGIAVFDIESDMNYSFYDVPDAPELWVHFYIMTDCTTPIFFTGSCGIYGTLGEEYFVSSTGYGSAMDIDDDYVIELQLDPYTTYYMVAASAGGTETVQESVEGCLSIAYFSPGILELYLPPFEIVAYPAEEEIELIKITDFLAREIEYPEYYTYYLFYYSDGTVKKQMIVE